MISVYTPEYEDLWFRESMLADEETMSFNRAWGGTIAFPREKWKDWYDRWIADPEGKRLYRYVRNEEGAFVGEIAYHYDGRLDGFAANVIISAAHRGHGYGGQALDMLIGIAEENGLTVLYDDIAIDNPAVGLFTARGFCEVSRTEKTIVLRKDLRPPQEGEAADGRNVIRCTDRAQWRAWLSAHFETEQEAWFVFPTVGSGEQGVSYNDAVEEALCFGWIDGKAGTLDKTHQLRRFTPRRSGSAYSRPNIERLIWLDAQGMIHPKVRPSVVDLIQQPFVFPEDILDAIRQDVAAWEHFEAFAEPYKRIRVAYIDAARNRPDEFEKRLDHFIRKTRANQIIIGYGGIEKYYN